MGLPSHRLFWITEKMPWFCAVFLLPAFSNTSWKPFPNHSVTVSSSTNCLIHSESATSEEPQLPGPKPKTFPFSFVAQWDLNTQSHLICFLLGFKETVFHFARSQVRETSKGQCPKPIQTAIQINIDWKKRHSRGEKKKATNFCD